MKYKQLIPYETPQCVFIPVLTEGCICNSITTQADDNESFEESDYIF